MNARELTYPLEELIAQAISPSEFAKYLAEEFDYTNSDALKNIIATLYELPTFAYLRAINNYIVKSIIDYSKLKKTDSTVENIQKNPLIFLRAVIEAGLLADEICGDFREIYSFLHIAIAVRNDEIFDYLLEVYQQNNLLDAPSVMLNDSNGLNCVALKDGGTPFHVASECHNIRMMNKLIEADVNINSRSISLKTPLFFALFRYKSSNRLEAIQLLVAHGADPALADCLYNLIPYEYNQYYVYEANETDLIVANEKIKSLLMPMMSPIDDLIKNTSDVFAKYKIKLEKTVESASLENLVKLQNDLKAIFNEFDDELIIKYQEFYNSSLDSNGFEKYINEFMPEFIRYGFSKIVENLIENHEFSYILLLQYDFMISDYITNNKDERFGVLLSDTNSAYAEAVSHINRELFSNNFKVLAELREGLFAILQQRKIDPYLFASRLLAGYYFLSSNALVEIIKMINEDLLDDRRYLREIAGFIYYQLVDYAEKSIEQKNIIKSMLGYALYGGLNIEERIHHEEITDNYISIFDICVLKNLTDIYDLFKGRNINIENKISSQSNATPVIIAAENNFYYILNDLLLNRHANVNAVSNKNKTAIYSAVCHILPNEDKAEISLEVINSYMEIIKLLIIYKADMQIVSNDNKTVLTLFSNKLQKQNQYKQIYYMLKNPDIIRLICKKFNNVKSIKANNIINEFQNLSATYKFIEGVAGIEIPKSRLSTKHRPVPKWFPNSIALQKNHVGEVILEKVRYPDKSIQSIVIELYDKFKPRPERVVQPVISIKSPVDNVTDKESSQKSSEKEARQNITDRKANPINVADIPKPKMQRGNSEPIVSQQINVLTTKKLAEVRQSVRRQTQKFLNKQRYEEAELKRAERRMMRILQTNDNSTQSTSSSSSSSPRSSGDERRKGFEVLIELKSTSLKNELKKIESELLPAENIELDELKLVIEKDTDHQSIDIASERVTIQDDINISSESVVVDGIDYDDVLPPCVSIDLIEDEMHLELLANTTASVLENILSEDENTAALNYVSIRQNLNTFFYFKGRDNHVHRIRWENRDLLEYSDNFKLK